MGLKRIGAASSALILGGVLLSGTTSAEPGAGESGTRVPGTGTHCVTNTDSGLRQCFATVAEATVFIDNSRAAKAASTDATTTALAGAYTAAVVWDYYGSPASNWITSDYQCTYYAAGNISTKMNDKASYVDVYPGCYLKLWTHTDQAGSVEEFPAGGWNVAQINNQASSFEIFP